MYTYPSTRRHKFPSMCYMCPSLDGVDGVDKAHLRHGWDRSLHESGTGILLKYYLSSYLYMYTRKHYMILYIYNYIYCWGGWCSPETIGSGIKIEQHNTNNQNNKDRIWPRKNTDQRSGKWPRTMQNHCNYQKSGVSIQNNANSNICKNIGKHMVRRPEIPSGKLTDCYWTWP